MRSVFEYVVHVYFSLPKSGWQDVIYKTTVYGSADKREVEREAERVTQEAHPDAYDVHFDSAHISINDLNKWKLWCMVSHIEKGTLPFVPLSWSSRWKRK